MNEKTRIRREWILTVVGDMLEEESEDLKERIIEKLGAHLFKDWDRPVGWEEEIAP